MPARQATVTTPRRMAMAEVPMPKTRRTLRVAAATPLKSSAVESAAAAEPAVLPEPQHAGAEWREHDLLIRRFQQAGLTPAEIAVVLHSKGLRVKTWHVSETFVRGRLKALGMTANPSRVWYGQHANCYRRRLPE